MNSHEIEHLLAEYVDGTLSPSDKALVEKHLDKCPDCASMVDELQRLLPMVRSLPEQNTPPGMVDKIFTATTRRRPRFLQKRKFLRPKYAPISAAAAVLVVVIAVYAVLTNVEMHGLLPSKFDLAKQEQALIGDKDQAGVDEDRITIDLKEELGFVPEISDRPTEPEAESMEIASLKKTKPEVATPIGALASAMYDGRGSEHAPAAVPSEVPTMVPPPAPAPTATRVVEEPLSGEAYGGAPGISDSLTADENAVAPPAPRPTMRADTVREKKKSMRQIDNLRGEERSLFAASEQQQDDGMQPVDREEADEAIGGIQNRWESAHCGVNKAGTMLITSEKQWEKLWQLLNAQMIDKPALPPVKFDKQVVVGVFMGLKNTGGYRLSILEVRRNGNAIEMIVDRTEPQPGQMVTMALTQPYSVVVVPRELNGLVIEEGTPIKVVYQ